MKAIVLAGGLGTRLKSVIAEIPKPMAPVNGKPFLEVLIQWLARWNISNIVLSVGYKKEVICDYFGDGSWLGACINYSSEESPLGTGGAIKVAMERFPDELYLVMNGDSLFDNDLSELIAYHRAKTAEITLALAAVEDIGRYGSVELYPDGSISRFLEKSGTGLGIINAGVYIIERRAEKFFPNGASSFEKDVLPTMIGNRLFGLCQKGYFVDIGVPSAYRHVCSLPDILGTVL